jgi:hypothetical protein
LLLTSSQQPNYLPILFPQNSKSTINVGNRQQPTIDCAISFSVSDVAKYCPHKWWLAKTVSFDYLFRLNLLILLQHDQFCDWGAFVGHS